MFEDTKVVTKTVNRRGTDSTISPKKKGQKDKQWSTNRRTDSTIVQRKKDKRTNNDLQNNK